MKASHSEKIKLIKHLHSFETNFDSLKKTNKKKSSFSMDTLIKATFKSFTSNH